MDSLMTSAEDTLLQSLSYKLGGTSNYITNRRMCTFNASGSNVYSPASGTRILRFRLSGDDFLDTDSVRVQFDVRNAGTHNLRPLNRPHAFFSRFRLSAGGIVIEDCMDFARCSELLQLCRSNNNGANDDSEGFGIGPNQDLKNDNYLGIPNGDFMTCVLKIHASGIFSSNKFLPLAYLKSLEIELELSDMSDPIIYPTAITDTQGLYGGFTTGNTSIQWEIVNPTIVCDMITLDSQLQNAFVSHLISGKSLKIPFSTYTSNIQTLLSNDSQINISRSLSSLQTVFISFDKKYTYTNPETAADGAVLNNHRNTFYLKPWNNFYNTMSGYKLNDPAMLKSRDVTYLMLNINSKCYPEYPISSSSLCMHYLRQALKNNSNEVHSIDITGKDYRSTKFITAINCEKASVESHFSGANTKNALITVKYKCPNVTVGVNATTIQPDKIHILIKSQQILEIMDSGCTVYD